MSILSSFAQSPTEHAIIRVDTASLAAEIQFLDSTITFERLPLPDSELPRLPLQPGVPFASNQPSQCKSNRPITMLELETSLFLNQIPRNPIERMIVARGYIERVVGSIQGGDLGVSLRYSGSIRKATWIFRLLYEQTADDAELDQSIRGLERLCRLSISPTDRIIRRVVVGIPAIVLTVTNGSTVVVENKGWKTERKQRAIVLVSESPYTVAVGIRELN